MEFLLIGAGAFMLAMIATYVVVSLAFARFA